MKIKQEYKPSFSATGAANNSNVVERSYINANEAARLLGVCKPSILRACKEGTIPHRRLGRRLIFSPEAIRKWAACED